MSTNPQPLPTPNLLAFDPNAQAPTNPLLDHIDQKFSELHPLAQVAIQKGLPTAGPTMADTLAKTPAAMAPIGGPMSTAKPLPTPAAPAESPENLANIAEQHRLQATGSGISQIGGPNPGIGSKILRGLAHTGEAIGSMFGPTRMAEAFIPGTELHHQMLLNRAGAAVNQSEQVENEQQKRSLEAAQAAELPGKQALTEAQTKNLESEASERERAAPGKERLTEAQIKNLESEAEARGEGKEAAHYTTTPDGKVLAITTDSKTGKHTVETIYEGQPGEKPTITTLEINGKPHRVLVDEKSGRTIKDLGESGEKPPVTNINAQNNERDREAARFAKPHEASLTAANAQLEKIADARSMINGNAEAQATGIPKVLTALVSGQGSGVRITQAELNMIGKARGVAGDIEGTLRKWAGKGQLTPEQQRQLTGMLDDVKARIVQKQGIVNTALDKINSVNSREEIVKADKEARQALGELEKGGGSGGGAPAAGTVEQGYRFKGGDWKDKANWEKVK